ncbi:MAG: DUF3093 domain-containing protein [Galactobacter sp.]
MPETSTPLNYQEKLRSPWWLWLTVVGISFAIGLSLSPTNVLLFVILTVVALIIGSVLLVASAPAIVVTETTLSVGRATIEREFLGEVTGYRGEDARYERGRGLNGLAFMCFRGWVDPVVKVEIADDRDETPYWLFSTRRPEQVVRALGGTMRTPHLSASDTITADNEPAAAVRDLPAATSPTDTMDDDSRST